MIPEFTQDQTDANLSRLANNQLDLVVGIKYAKFKDSNIHFTKLYDEELYCELNKDHILAKDLKAHKKKTVTTKDLWEYRQIISVPPYLIRNLFSRRRYIVPVNEEADNAISTNATEAYGLLLANYGICFYPDCYNTGVAICTNLFHLFFAIYQCLMNVYYPIFNYLPIQNLILYKTLSRLIFCYQIYRKALYLAKFNDVNFPNDNIRDYIMLYRFSKLIRENIREIFISATRTEG